MVIVVIFSGVSCRHGFDIHAAFGRDDHRDAPGGAIDQHRQVVFLGDVGAIGHVEAVDLLAGFAGLDRNQGVAEHVGGVGANFVEALRQAHAAFGALAQFLELALAAAAGVDLRFHDIERSGELAGGRHRLVDGQRGMAGGNGDAEFRKQFLGLIFVNVHRLFAFRWCVRRPWGERAGLCAAA